MPGLCLRRGASATSGATFSTVADSLHQDRAREASVTLETDALQVGHTGYPTYPVSTHERGRFHVVLEGELYDRDRAAVLDVAPALLEGGDRDAVASWLRSVDGEFVCCVVDTETDALAVLTDLFARLPVYYHHDGGQLLVGREGRFLLEQLPDVAFDRMAIAQCLLVAYTLGDRTLWEGVRKLPPAGLLTCDPAGEVSVERLHTFDFDEPAHADRSVQENAAALASRFEAACERRARARSTTVVSLSGGHDSRAVAAGLHAADVPFTAATFDRGADSGGPDVRIARDVADVLGVDWDRYDLSPPDPEEMRRLLAMKGGMNHLGMGFILEFFEALVDRHGPDVTCLTGDGGDKVVPDLAPGKPIDDLDELAEYTVAKNDVFSPAAVSRLTGLPREALLAEVRSVLAGYPEDRMAAKYVHFITHERGFNWLFEAEDRNRHFLWSTSPFYATDVFTYGMNVPPEQKANDRFYRAFLRALWPRAVEFDAADYGTPMSSPRYALVQRFLGLLARYPVLEDVVRVLYRGEVTYDPPEAVSGAMEAQLAECDAIDRYLSSEAVAERLADGGGGRQQLYNLFTLTSAIAARECDRDTIVARPNVPTT